MKLLKQPAPGDWESVISSVTDQLRPLLTNRSQQQEVTKTTRGFEDLLDQITLLKLKTKTAANPEKIEQELNQLEQEIQTLEQQYEHVTAPGQLDQLAERLINANRFLLKSENELEEAHNYHEHILRLKQNIKNEIHDLVNVSHN